MPGCRDGGVGIRRAQPHPEKPIRASVPQIVFSHKTQIVFSHESFASGRTRHT
jgi:hypothetical protein